MTISCGNGYKDNVTPQNVIITAKCNINAKCTMQYELLHNQWHFFYQFLPVH